jgi:hypothetical protein
MSAKFAFKEVLLHRDVERVRIFQHLGISLAIEGLRPQARTSSDLESDDPVWLDNLAGCARVWEWVQCRVLAACATDGIVADLHRGLGCDAVDCVGEGVLGVFLDVGGAGWGVVVPGFFGAVGFYEVKVLGGAGC